MGLASGRAWRRSATHRLLALAESFADPGVGAAPADVADPVEVLVGDGPVLRLGTTYDGHCGHDLPCLAVASLAPVPLHPPLLHGVQSVRSTLSLAVRFRQALACFIPLPFFSPPSLFPP